MYKHHIYNVVFVDKSFVSSAKIPFEEIIKLKQNWLQKRIYPKSIRFPDNLNSPFRKQKNNNKKEHVQYYDPSAIII